MTIFMVSAVFERITSFFEPVRQLLNNIADMITTSRTILWVIVIGMAIVLLIIIIAVGKDKKKRRKRDNKYPNREKAKVFIPIDNEGIDIKAEFYTLQDSIINSRQVLERKLIEKIKNKGPKVLAELVPAYDKAEEEIKVALKDLVKKERLMERYSLRLNRPDYPMGVLVEAWSSFPDPDTMKEFVELLANPDETIQLAGTRLLQALRDPQILSPLTAALLWPEHFVPARVAEVFSSMGTQGAAVLSYMLPEVENKHKARILDTIAIIEAAFPIDNVSACLQNKDPSIRTAAVVALGAGRMTEGLAPLMVAASDSNWQVRAAVAKALGMIGDKRCLNVLEVLSVDEEGWVATSAKETLKLFAAS